MVLGGALGIKRITRIGSRNIFTIAAIGLAAYLLLSKSGQEKARGGIPLITSAGEAIGGTLEAILPLDIFGRELKGFGEGFGDFGYGINRGFANIFAPIKNFVNWASEKIGLGIEVEFDKLKKQNFETRLDIKIPMRDDGSVGYSV